MTELNEGLTTVAWIKEEDDHWAFKLKDQRSDEPLPETYVVEMSNPRFELEIRGYLMMGLQYRVCVRVFPKEPREIRDGAIVVHTVGITVLPRTLLMRSRSMNVHGRVAFVTSRERAEDSVEVTMLSFFDRSGRYEITGTYLLPGWHADFDRLYHELVELAKHNGGVLLTVDPHTNVIRSVTFGREFRFAEGEIGRGLRQG